MVLEQLYSIQWLTQKAKYAYLMGFVYALLGMVSAIFLFPKDPGLVAVAFTALLILPSLSKLLTLEENRASMEPELNIWFILEDHWDLFKIYTFLFLGILTAFALFAATMPQVASSQIFEEQLDMLGLTGKAVDGISGFSAIFSNNMKVLVFCVIASFIYGSGAVFIITWNASVWGAVFGIVAKNSAQAGNPLIYLLLTLLAVFPHMLAEASSYILAAISGGIISKATIREKAFSVRFTRILQDGLVIFVFAMIVLVAAGLIEVYVTKHLLTWFGLR